MWSHFSINKFHFKFFENSKFLIDKRKYIEKIVKKNVLVANSLPPYIITPDCGLKFIFHQPSTAFTITNQ